MHQCNLNLSSLLIVYLHFFHSVDTFFSLLILNNINLTSTQWTRYGDTFVQYLSSNTGLKPGGHCSKAI